MKKTNRLLCLLLSLVMVLALLPTMAFAADDAAEAPESDASAEGVVSDIIDVVVDASIPTYAVYVKNPLGLPASGAQLILTEQNKLLDGTIGAGKSYRFTANALGLVLIPKSLTATYTLSATWQSPLLGVKYISLPGLTWSVSIAPDIDLITVYPIPDIGLNLTDHIAYIEGYPDGTVRPNGTLTRAEAAAMIYRVFKPGMLKEGNLDAFKDMKGHWAQKYVAALAEKGVINGTSATTFSPNTPIKRQELFTMIGRMFGEAYTTDGIIGNTFADIGSGYYVRFINLLYTLGLVKGDNNNTVRPADNITRAETAALLNRLLLRSPAVESSSTVDNAKVWPDNPIGAWYYADIMEASNSHNYTLDVKVLTLGSHFVEHWTEIK